VPPPFASSSSWRRALRLASSNGSNLPRTAVGLTSATIIVLFALFFGIFVRGHDPSVAATSTPPHMVDPFLVSFGTALTGGFFDVALHGLLVRIGALVEMLLTVSVAGGSLYTASNNAWTKIAGLFVQQG
jgi:hypothetical protein